jgi:hypothetical protein
MLALPRELIIYILSFVEKDYGIRTDDPVECESYYGQLYRTSKAYLWMRAYEFIHLWETEYSRVIMICDVNGKVVSEIDVECGLVMGYKIGEYRNRYVNEGDDYFRNIGTKWFYEDKKCKRGWVGDDYKRIICCCNSCTQLDVIQERIFAAHTLLCAVNEWPEWDQRVLICEKNTRLTQLELNYENTILEPTKFS